MNFKSRIMEEGKRETKVTVKKINIDELMQVLAMIKADGDTYVNLHCTISRNQDKILIGYYDDNNKEVEIPPNSFLSKDDLDDLLRNSIN